MREPLFSSDGEVDPISHAPRIPHQDFGEDGGPLKPHIEMVLLLAITGGVIVWLWGAFEVVCWAWRLLK